MDARRQVCLIFKECVHNIARHSGCAQAAVELTVAGRFLTYQPGDRCVAFTALAGQLIHTGELNGAHAFDYLRELPRHAGS